MSNKGLPPAKSTEKNVKFGNTVIKAEKPSQSFDDAVKGLNRLERAAKAKVFTSNEPTT